MSIPHAAQKISYQGEDVQSWDKLGKDDAGDPLELTHHTNMHIQVLGELSSGRPVMQGSNVEKPEETDWAYLTDAQGFPIQFTTVSIIKRAHTVPRWIRPKVEGGDDNTVVTFLIAMRKG